MKCVLVQDKGEDSTSGPEWGIVSDRHRVRKGEVLKEGFALDFPPGTCGSSKSYDDLLQILLQFDGVTEERIGIAMLLGEIVSQAVEHGRTTPA